MTYIDYLNRFNQFLESNALPPAAQLMYYKLLSIFNRAGWPPTVQVDNNRLMVMTGLNTPKSAIRARDGLVHAGLIHYKQGRKGSPNAYALREICLFSPNSGTRKDTINDTVNDTENDTTNVTHIKNKTKKKTRTTPPKPPQGASWSGPSYDIDELAAISSFDVPDEL